jgi:orotate phosphoribosyltransferase
MVDPLRVNSQRIEELLFAAGALEHGHFLWQGGQHTDKHLQTLVALQPGHAVIEIAQILSARSSEIVGALGGETDFVVGADESVAILASEIGRNLGVPSIVAGDATGAGEIPPRARILLVAGDLETGTPIQVLLPSLYAAGAHPIAVAVVAARSVGFTEIEAEGRDPIPLIAGIELDISTFNPGECPLCLAGEPIGPPGSSGR